MYEEEVLYSLAKINTIEISVFDFVRNLIIVSINYDIYEEKIYGYVYTYDLHKILFF